MTSNSRATKVLFVAVSLLILVEIAFGVKSLMEMSEFFGPGCAAEFSC